MMYCGVNGRKASWTEGGREAGRKREREGGRQGGRERGWEGGRKGEGGKDEGGGGNIAPLG